MGNEEESLLDKISQTSDRLSFENYKSDQIIPHGTLLDLIFKSNKSPYFSFCDSDIFLFYKLQVKKIFKLLNGSDVFSTGGRIENLDDAVYAGFKGGATTISPDGKIDLATSFFCSYKRKPLEKIMKKYKVGFEQYRYESQIPSEALAVVKELKLDYEMFDTGKLLSVLYHYEGYKKVFNEIEGLIHVGGMSGRYLQKIDLKEVNTLTDDDLELATRTNNNSYQTRNSYEVSLKKYYGKYFYMYLNHLVAGTCKPISASNDSRIKATITKLESNINKVMFEAKNDAVCKKILTLVSGC